MLHIILLILKILGLLVLVLLGLLFVITLLVLLIPVRYQAVGTYYGKIKGKIRISWLLHILSVTVVYKEAAELTVRLFGFRILKPQKVNKELDEAEDIMVHAMETKGQEIAGETAEEVMETGRKSAKKALVKEGAEGRHKKPALVPGESRRRPSKICFLFSWLKRRILDFLEKIKLLFRRFCETLKSAKEKKSEIQSFLTDRKNQKTAKLLFKQIKKLLRHIFPRKGKGNITFGFEDPYMTGQILTYASVIYPFFHKHLNLYPVFDQTVFMADGNFKGRIRMGTVLFIGIRMLIDKNFRNLLKRWL